MGEQKDRMLRGEWYLDEPDLAPRAQLLTVLHSVDDHERRRAGWERPAPITIVGLLSPDEGNVTVLGRPAGTMETLPRIAFLAQDKPLYDGFTVAEMLRFGAHMNPRRPPNHVNLTTTSAQAS